MNGFFKKQLGERWLSGAALAAVLGAWAGAGCYGWLKTTEGVMTVVACVLTVGCQVYAARALKNAAETTDVGRKLALLGLGAACLSWTGFSGHRGLEVSERERWAPYEAQQAAVKASKDLDAQIAAVPALPLSDEYGRPLGPIRTQVLADARAANIAYLESRRVPVGTVVARPADKMPEPLSWAFVLLVEALELGGFYAISRARGGPAMFGDSNHGRGLANMRWNKVNAAMA